MRITRRRLGHHGYVDEVFLKEQITLGNVKKIYNCKEIFKEITEVEFKEKYTPKTYGVKPNDK